MSRTELAELTGIKADTINKSISRDSDVSAEIALTIAEKLSLSIEELLGKTKTTTDRIKEFNSSKNSEAVYETVKFISKYSDFLKKYDILEESDKKIIKELVESFYSKKKSSETVLNYTIGNK